MSTAKKIIPKKQPIYKTKPQKTVVNVVKETPKKMSSEKIEYIQSVGEKVEKRLAIIEKNSNVVPQKKKAGRLLFDGKKVEVVIAKLEAAFSVGATDEQACMQADISIDALYRYCAKYPEFRNRKEILKTKPNLGAKVTLAVTINERDEKNQPTDRAINVSKWQLEKTESQNYVNKQLNANLNLNANPLTPERIEQIETAQRAWDSVDDEDWEDSDYEVEH